MSEKEAERAIWASTRAFGEEVAARTAARQDEVIARLREEIKRQRPFRSAC